MIKCRNLDLWTRVENALVKKIIEIIERYRSKNVNINNNGSNEIRVKSITLISEKRFTYLSDRVPF